MEKFEYKIVVIDDLMTTSEFEEQINQLGKQGWELVSSVAQANNVGRTIYIINLFKRKIHE